MSTAVGRRRLLTFGALAMIGIGAFIGHAVCADTTPWVPMEERIAVWDEVASQRLGVPVLEGSRPYEVSSNGLEATFARQGTRWTIVGANAAVVSPTTPPARWPVTGEAEIVVVPDPITNDYILPFSDRLPAAAGTATLRVAGAPDSFEPASFVIRAGDADLSGVTVKVDDLVARSPGATGQRAFIPATDVDVRVVKCWYQAGIPLSDVRHKTLKPELLLHDDALVDVDYRRQVELIRDYDRLEDAPTLRPFVIPGHQNKQVWLTVHIRDPIPPGLYTGPVSVALPGGVRRLTLEVEVLPFRLPAPALDYALYYEGILTDESPFRPEARRKTTTQMRAELLDMKAHGLDNATVLHDVGADRSAWGVAWARLERTLELRNGIGWTGRPLLYLDWNARFSDDLALYRTKVAEIARIAKSRGIDTTFVYGADEREGRDFTALTPVYRAVHEAGAKNFVAMTEKTYLSPGGDLIDLPIFWGTPGIHMKHVDELKKRGVRVWKYSQPQGGLEEPATYRAEYGVKLLALGFSGACDYQYQKHSWNDFDDPRGRNNVMAYPTVADPVPTLQWEGWRTAVDDVRYVTLALREGLIAEEWLRQTCAPDPRGCRQAVIRLLAARAKR